MELTIHSTDGKTTSYESLKNFNDDALKGILTFDSTKTVNIATYEDPCSRYKYYHTHYVMNKSYVDWYCIVETEVE